MKRCLACGCAFQNQDWTCPACGASPDLLGGFYSFAPTLAQENEGFKSASFNQLSNLEERHFWFRARNRLILWAIRKYAVGFQSFLEIGCGTGFVLSGIAHAFPSAHLWGAEIYSAGLGFASARNPAIEFIQMDAGDIPFVDEFDAIGAFDVLEHIREDEKVLIQIHNALKSKGTLLLTVPQHDWLWSPTDDYACHVRRYAANDLHAKLRNAGFEILRSTSFVTALLPAMWASRMVQKVTDSPNTDAAEILKISPILNLIFGAVLWMELKMIRGGVSFPLGGSRLIVARKAS